MLKEKISNSNEFSDSEKNLLLKLLKKEEESSFEGFPDEYEINIGYEEGMDECVHLIKKNPGNVPGLEDCRYLLIMIKDGRHIIVDGSDMPNGHHADNTEEIEHYMKMEESNVQTL